MNVCRVPETWESLWSDGCDRLSNPLQGNSNVCKCIQSPCYLIQFVLSQERSDCFGICGKSWRARAAKIVSLFLYRATRMYAESLLLDTVCVQPEEVSMLWYLWYVASSGGCDRLWETENGAQVPTIIQWLKYFSIFRWWVNDHAAVDSGGGRFDCWAVDFYTQRQRRV